jgi:hypothetical protein
MDTQGPELPPRKTHTFFSPSFLLQYYETKSSNHRHVFKTRNSDERSLCLHCHLWLISRFEASEEACSYPCHHFHDTSENTYNCCHCGHLAAFETEEPHMPIDILSEIVATRPKAVTFAETAQLKGAVAPTVVSTLDTALLYIKDLLSGQRRNVNTSNPNFISRVGMSSSR